MRRFATARRTTGWVSPKRDLGPVVVLGVGGAWWTAQNSSTNTDPEAWLIPALVGIGLIAVYWVVIGFAEFVWRFAQAGIRNEFDDYKEAEGPDEAEQIIERMVNTTTAGAGEFASWFGSYGSSMVGRFTALDVERMLTISDPRLKEHQSHSIIRELQTYGLVDSGEHHPADLGPSGGTLAYTVHTLTPLGHQVVRRLSKGI